MTLSPAERYAASRIQQVHPKTLDFTEKYPFALDPFQIAGCHALEDGFGVLVAAPTGAGKTVVGEFSAHLALLEGKKCFYTTPIKALSNQKYQDLIDMFGEQNVGLLTGDTSINAESSIVVMTTEVLRNMIYSNSHTLSDLKYVVMDEVHYLADKFRGAVWEEILIHLPESVQVASLSATVSNAEEFGDWLQTVRGETQVIVSEIRPVPLYQHVLFTNRLLDLFAENGKVNPEILRLERESYRQIRTYGNKRHSSKSSRTDKFPNIKVLSRPEVIEKLDREGMLPAITFIFSRKACDIAVHQCLSAGLKLTTSEERSEIRLVVANAAKNIPEEDLFVLKFHEWADALERGIAAHHAGLLPTFKETVEELFQRGLVKAVFATETLALGINMPAKTVVLEKLTKWNGEAHVNITPGEYTQLTGRAGRRGIDVEGNAVIIWTKDIDSNSVGGLASARTYPLRSSFKPTYNMSINLVSQFGADRARASLESSFAQFQADKAVVGLAKQIKRNQKAIDEMAIEDICHLGDFIEYSQIKANMSELEKSLHKVPKRQREEFEQEIVELRRSLRAHPCHACHERDEHSQIMNRISRLMRENRGLSERMNNRTNVIAKRFDRIQILLEKFGYLFQGEITAAGKLLSKIYSETDLLIAEIIRDGTLAELNAAELVSVLSTFLYESRRDETPKIPKGNIQQALTIIIKKWNSIHEEEIEIGLEPMREPELGFCWASYSWANGHSLSSILKGTELTVGDFVRQMKQIIDLLRQLLNATPELSPIIKDALKRIDRGVVTYAGVLL